MIGLDIDRDHVRIVELKEHAEGLTLTRFAVARVSLQSAAESISEAIARTISQTFKQEGFEDKEVYTSIYGPRVQVRRISLPAMPRNEMAEAVKWEAKNFVPFAIETAAIDYHLLKKPEGQSTKQDLIVVAVDGEALKRHVDIIRAAGLKCAGVMPAPFAVWELAKFQPDFSTPELKGLANIGEGSTSLTLFRDHELLFSRDIDFSADSIARSLASALEIEAPEAEKIIEGSGNEPEGLQQALHSIFGKLQNELLSSLEFFREQFAEEKVEHFFMLGRTAQLKDLGDYLAANFGIPIDVVDPLRGLRLDPKLGQEKLQAAAQQLAVAIGLALGKSRAINLVKVKAAKKEAGLESLTFLDYVAIPNSAIIGTLALFVALIFGLNFYLSMSINQIKKDLDSKSIRLSQLVKLRDRTKAYEDISRQDVDVKGLLSRVNSLMPAGLTLSNLTFDQKGRAVVVGGESPDPKIASEFVKRVEESPYFKNAVLIEIKKVGTITTFKTSFNLN